MKICDFHYFLSWQDVVILSRFLTRVHLPLPLANGFQIKGKHSGRGDLAPTSLDYGKKSRVFNFPCKSCGNSSDTPKPASVGTSINPSTIRSGGVRRVPRHSTSPQAYSRIAKFGILATHCTLAAVATGPLGLCGVTAIFTDAASPAIFFNPNNPPTCLTSGRI